MKKIWRFIIRTNFKTLYVNFHKLPFHQAKYLPIQISSKTYLKNITGNFKIEGPIKPGLVKIGYGDIGIFDKRRSRTICEIVGNIVFKGVVDIGHGSKISVGKDGTLVLNKDFKITAETTIVCCERIEFGSNCLISWDTLIMDTDFHLIRNITGEIINANKAILIGNNVWIGCRSLILKGTIIPDGTVIAASSLVSGELSQNNSLYAGNPAKLLKEKIIWNR